MACRQPPRCRRYRRGPSHRALDVAKQFDLAKMSGSHGIGHTRMATESAVTTMGAHPFSTGKDQCLVHNGSLSNHNSLRRELKRDGMTFETRERYRSRGRLSHLAHDGEGMNLGEALKAASTISTASSPSSSAPRTASASCAIRSPASPPLWPRPTICRLRFRIPRAGQSARHREGQGLGAGAFDRLFWERKH
jgi:hypothetical protein